MQILPFQTLLRVLYSHGPSKNTEPKLLKGYPGYPKQKGCQCSLVGVLASSNLVVHMADIYFSLDGVLHGSRMEAPLLSKVSPILIEIMSIDKGS